MLPPFIRHTLESQTGEIGSWLAARRLRKARIRRQRMHRWQQRLRRFVRAVVVTGGILLTALIVALVNGGLDDFDLIATGLAAIIAFVGLLIFPRSRVPTADDLRDVPFNALGRASEDWLETQRPLMSGPAQSPLDSLGTRLEHLSPQLSQLDERTPIGHEIRGLLADHVPAIVESYVRIPETHRTRPDAAGMSPEARLVSSLAIIEREIESVTGHISRGEFDELAIRGRYLELRYQTAVETDI